MPYLQLKTVGEAGDGRGYAFECLDDFSQVSLGNSEVAFVGGGGGSGFEAQGVGDFKCAFDVVLVAEIEGAFGV